jgi:hypothetical protein
MSSFTQRGEHAELLQQMPAALAKSANYTKWITPISLEASPTSLIIVKKMASFSAASAGEQKGGEEVKR